MLSSHAVPHAVDPVVMPGEPLMGTPTGSAMQVAIAETLQLLHNHLAPQRRIVHAGDVVHQEGDCFDNLYVLNAGFIKVVSFSADGREQVVGLRFRGDWLGFDSIAAGRYVSTAVAMDVGEVWTVRYEALMEAGLKAPVLLRVMHQAMSRVMARDRDAQLSLSTLPADARVADFLRYWADAMACRGLRTDQITLRMTRAEIGNYLGMTLESVSRALSKLARDKLIQFAEKGRREIQIPDLCALSVFVQRSGVSSSLLQ